MKIDVNDDDRIVSVWLTNADQADEALRQSLKPLYQSYHAQKYLVAVYLSGKGDLFENTLALLRRHKYKQAASS